VDFVNTPIIVHRGDRPLDKNTFVVKTDLQMTKPELKQILGKLYGLEVRSIDTTILMGKIKKTLFRSKFSRLRKVGTGRRMRRRLMLSWILRSTPFFRK
jgi:ribosomal protein L23